MQNNVDFLSCLKIEQKNKTILKLDIEIEFTF